MKKRSSPRLGVFAVIFFLVLTGSGLFADEAAPAAPSTSAPATPSAPSPAAPQTPMTQEPPSMWPMLLILGGIMYFMMIRPQRKEEKVRKEMLSQLKKNDHVLTSGGLYGVVASATDEDVVLKVDESKDIRVKVTRASIAKVLSADGASSSPNNK